MTRLLARLVLAFSAVLAAPIFSMALFQVLLSVLSYSMLPVVFAVALSVTALLFVIAWIAIWHGQVIWSRRRRLLTCASVFWSLGVGGILGLGIAAITGEAFLGVFFGGMFWFAMWIPSTVLLWRETAPERVARLRSIAVGAVTCPNCGYNMTGLHEARCPECGSRYTLNELLASGQDSAGDLEPQASFASEP